MPETTIPAQQAAALAGAVEIFVALFADSLSAVDLSERMTCSQVEALADLLETAGRPVAAEVWREQHAATDEPGDLHHPEDDEDERTIEERAFDAEFIGI